MLDCLDPNPLAKRCRDQSQRLCRVAMLLLVGSRHREAIDCLNLARLLDPSHEGAAEALHFLTRNS